MNAVERAQWELDRLNRQYEKMLRRNDPRIQRHLLRIKKQKEKLAQAEYDARPSKAMSRKELGIIGATLAVGLAGLTEGISAALGAK